MGLFTDTITIYNHKEDDTYQRTVIKGVQYSKKRKRLLLLMVKLILEL